jgi:hypothetical protein
MISKSGSPGGLPQTEAGAGYSRKQEVLDPAALGVHQVLYSLREARAAFGFGRSYIYQLIASGELRSIKSGKLDESWASTLLVLLSVGSTDQRHDG